MSTSQFVILPPYQHQGHGCTSTLSLDCIILLVARFLHSARWHVYRDQKLTGTAKLYSALYQLCLSRPDVAELTVEDPAEAFEDLRDRCDLRYLVSQGVPDDPQFLANIGQKSLRAEWEEGVRTKLKIAQVSGSFRNTVRGCTWWKRSIIHMA